MKLLFFTPSPEHYMRPPRLAEEQVVCGPDFGNGTTKDGLPCHRTPLGGFDTAEFLASLPEAPQPDLLVCLVDASWRCLPSALHKLRCPKILLVADTHHLSHPLTGMLDYARSEPFDRIILLYGRHHAPFFKASGLKQVHWLPGLSFPYSDQAVGAAAQVKRRSCVSFYGQTGRFHPRRRRLLEGLAAAGLPLRISSGSQEDCLPFYGQSLVGFNASLNGDLNLRVFEILASGAALLTDRLGAGAGLDRLLPHGQAYVDYASEDALVSAARDLLREPASAQALGAKGRDWLRLHYNEQKRRELFHCIVEGRDLPDAFRLEDSPVLSLASGTPEQWRGTLCLYETLQEVHRTREKVRLSVPPALEEAWAPLAASLPRVSLTRETAELELGFDAAHPGTPVFFRQDPAQPQLGRLAYQAANNWQARHLFPGDAPTPDPTQESSPVLRARDLLSEARLAEAFELARSALEDPAERPRLLVLIAEVALLSGKLPLAEKVLGDALRAKAPDKDLRRVLGALQGRDGRGTLPHLRASALLELGCENEALTLCRRVLAQHPSEPAFLRCQLRAQSRLGLFADCLSGFLALPRSSPGQDAEFCLLAGQAAFRLGRTNEALACFAEAAAFEATRFTALSELLEVYVALGRREESRQTLGKLESFARTDPRLAFLKTWSAEVLAARRA